MNFYAVSGMATGTTIVEAENEDKARKIWAKKALKEHWLSKETIQTFLDKKADRIWISKITVLRE